ncbi:MAG: tetratricopeptide repeat protein [Rikenellaceae bacterium]
MSSNTQPAQEQEILGSAASKTELFIEKNGRNLVYALAAVVLVAVIVFGARAFIVEPREQRAVEMIFAAQQQMESLEPDYNVALMGDGVNAGFLDIIEDYGSTKSGNIAKHYAGISYLNLGDLENAAKYLAMYKPVKGLPGTVINAQNLGVQGDIASQNGDYAQAVKLYLAAVESADNDITSPLYMLKAALVLSATGDKAKAEELLTSIKSEYPNSLEARDADKYIGKL